MLDTCNNCFYCFHSFIFFQKFSSTIVSFCLTFRLKKLILNPKYRFFSFHIPTILWLHPWPRSTSYKADSLFLLKIHKFSLEKHFPYVELLILTMKSPFRHIPLRVCMYGVGFLLLQEQKKPLQCPDWKPVNCSFMLYYTTNLNYQPCILLRKELFSWVSLSEFPCFLLYAFFRRSFFYLNFWICNLNLKFSPLVLFFWRAFSHVSSSLTEAPRS